MSARLHPRLAAALEDPHSEEWFDVILELPPVKVDAGGSRSEVVSRMQSKFQTIAAPVKAAVETAGGTVLGEAWINSTLKCRVTPNALRTLKERDDIVKIDLPRRLSR